MSKSNNKAAAAVSDIFRRHAWVITGTPLTSNVEEMQVELMSESPQGGETIM